jgi:hypothetical protein
MTYRGKLQNGIVLLDAPIDLPNGTEVRVEPVSPPNIQPAATKVEGPSWAEVFKDVLGKTEDLPDDLAENHDHYIHGAPKK